MLTPIVFSNEFEAFMNRYVSYTISGNPAITDFKAITDDNGVIVPPIGDFPFQYAAAYETYSLTGEVLGAEHGSQTPVIIESFLRTYSISVLEFATALANYWATVLLIPSAPMHGGVSVVSVVNDAASKVGAFHSAITASLTTDYKYPVMVHFIENVESIALPQVTWTVTELFSNGSTASFPEKVF